MGGWVIGPFTQKADGPYTWTFTWDNFFPGYQLIQPLERGFQGGVTWRNPSNSLGSAINSSEYQVYHLDIEALKPNTADFWIGGLKF